jgi:hypothetical protein
MVGYTDFGVKYVPVNINDADYYKSAGSVDFSTRLV